MCTYESFFSETNKAGQCPKKCTILQSKKLLMGHTCNHECNDDSKCPGSKKCCYDGCGLRCMPAVDTKRKLSIMFFP